MNSPDDLLRRVRRLEDRAEIGELVARYCLVMDDRDMTGMTELFTPDAIVRSSDGGMHASGLTAVTAMFRARFAVLGPSNHFTHDMKLNFINQFRFQLCNHGVSNKSILEKEELISQFLLWFSQRRF